MTVGLIIEVMVGVMERKKGRGGVNSHWTCDKGDWTGKAFTPTEREQAACLMVIVKV